MCRAWQFYGAEWVKIAPMVNQMRLNIATQTRHIYLQFLFFFIF